jgi:hypothetical protein
MDYANSAGKKEADAAKRILCLIQWNASELIEKAASMKLIDPATPASDRNHGSPDGLIPSPLFMR